MAELSRSQRYRIRVYESGDQDGATQEGTLVIPIEKSFTIHAYSGDEAEALVRRDVLQGKLPRGKVYQLCPWLGNAEFIRSIAASLDGSFARVFLDPASGLYAELRRIRFARQSAVSGKELVRESLVLDNELVQA